MMCILIELFEIHVLYVLVFNLSFSQKCSEYIYICKASRLPFSARNPAILGAPFNKYCQICYSVSLRYTPLHYVLTLAGVVLRSSRGLGGYCTDLPVLT